MLYVDIVRSCRVFSGTWVVVMWILSELGKLFTFLSIFLFILLMEYLVTLANCLLKAFAFSFSVIFSLLLKLIDLLVSCFGFYFEVFVLCSKGYVCSSCDPSFHLIYLSRCLFWNLWFVCLCYHLIHLFEALCDL